MHVRPKSKAARLSSPYRFFPVFGMSLRLGLGDTVSPQTRAIGTKVPAESRSPARSLKSMSRQLQKYLRERLLVTCVF